MQFQFESRAHFPMQFRAVHSQFSLCSKFVNYNGYHRIRFSTLQSSLRLQDVALTDAQLLKVLKAQRERGPLILALSRSVETTTTTA